MLIGMRCISNHPVLITCFAVVQITCWNREKQQGDYHSNLRRWKLSNRNPSRWGRWLALASQKDTLSHHLPKQPTPSQAPRSQRSIHKGTLQSDSSPRPILLPSNRSRNKRLPLLLLPESTPKSKLRTKHHLSDPDKLAILRRLPRKGPTYGTAQGKHRESEMDERNSKWMDLALLRYIPRHSRGDRSKRNHD